MDQEGFRAFLATYQLSAEKLDSALSLAERFEQYALQAGGFSAETVWAFSQSLIDQQQNNFDNYLALARYGRFIQDNNVFAAVLELLDGAEAQENLYRQVAETHGETLRDEVFAGIGVAPLGLPTPAKPGYMQPVIRRLGETLGEERCRELLADSLRDLPDEYFADVRELFLSSQDIDEFLASRKEKFLAELETCRRDGRLFFAQEVTEEVLDYVRSQPEIGGGVREGQVVFETKIPFLTAAYLAENDPIMQHYYYCHCPWAREAIRLGEPVSANFCNCSAGFHKKPWEVALGVKVRAEVLESVLQGDDRCRFAIHLPENGA
jgi:hypothetical protein